MAKKQFNVRLSAEALLAIKIKAKERHCTEAELIEFWATGSSGVTGNTVACDAAVAGSSPALPTIAKDEKRAMFEALKAKLAGGGKLSDLTEPARLLDDTGNPASPRAPFDFNQEGEPHRVTQMGKRLGLFYLGGGEPVFSRYLELGEMERFWEQRIK